MTPCNEELEKKLPVMLPLRYLLATPLNQSANTLPATVSSSAPSIRATSPNTLDMHAFTLQHQTHTLTILFSRLYHQTAKHHCSRMPLQIDSLQFAVSISISTQQKRSKTLQQDLLFGTTVQHIHIQPLSFWMLRAPSACQHGRTQNFTATSSNSSIFP